MGERKNMKGEVPVEFFNDRMFECPNCGTTVRFSAAIGRFNPDAKNLDVCFICKNKLVLCLKKRIVTRR